MKHNHTLNNLLIEHLPHIRRVVKRVAVDDHLTDDIVQECCAHIMIKGHLWDGNISKFKAWASVVSRNTAINHLLKRNRQQKNMTSSEEEPFFEDDHLLQERIRWTLDHINDLPPRQRQLLELKYLQGMRPIDIAHHLELSKQTVSNQINLALKTMQKKAKRAELLSLMFPWTWFKKSKAKKKASLLSSSYAPFLWIAKKPLALIAFGMVSLVGISSFALITQSSADKTFLELNQDSSSSQNQALSLHNQSHHDSNQQHPKHLSNTSKKMKTPWRGLIANAGPDLTVLADDRGKAIVSLDGSASSSDQTIINYTWLKNDKVIATGEKSSIELGTGVHDLILTVIDSRNPPQPAFDALRIGVLAPEKGSLPQQPEQQITTAIKHLIEKPILFNKTLSLSFPPVASAGADQIVKADANGFAQVELDASASFAVGNYQIVSYQWRFKQSDQIVAQSTRTLQRIKLPIGEHRLVLTIQDNYPNPGQDQDEVKITVIGQDASLLIADAGPDSLTTQANAEGIAQVPLSGHKSQDLKGHPPDRYQWKSLLDDQELFLADGVHPVVPLAVGNHAIKLTVWNDDYPQMKDHDLIRVQVLPEGTYPPISNAGPGQTVLADHSQLATVELDGSQSHDPDGGSIINYEWILISDEEGDDQNLISSVVTPELLLPVGIHTIQLNVEDDEGLTGSSTTTVTVLPQDNLPPVADAGDDIEITTSTESASIVLTGQRSYDPDGEITYYKWYYWKDDNWDLIYTDSEDPHYEMRLGLGQHLLKLLVEDNGAAHNRLESTDTVNVTVISHWGDDPTIHFLEDFNRADHDTLENQWVEIENSQEDITIKDQSVFMREGWRHHENQIERTFDNYDLEAQTLVASYLYIPVTDHDKSFTGTLLKSRDDQDLQELKIVYENINGQGALFASYTNHETGYNVNESDSFIFGEKINRGITFEISAITLGYEIRLWRDSWERPENPHITLYTGDLINWNKVRFRSLSNDSDAQVKLDDVFVQSYPKDDQDS